MDLERVEDTIKQQDDLSNTLGMEFISTPGPGTCMVQMKIDDNNGQVFGFLSGDATSTLAENLAGVGSMTLCPDEICVGVNVGGNHVRPMMKGDTVTAYGRLQRKSDTLHQWHIEIRDQNNKFISTTQMINFTMRRPKK